MMRRISLLESKSFSLMIGFCVFVLRSYWPLFVTCALEIFGNVRCFYLDIKVNQVYNDYKRKYFTSIVSFRTSACLSLIANM